MMPLSILTLILLYSSLFLLAVQLVAPSTTTTSNDINENEKDASSAKQAAIDLEALNYGIERIRVATEGENEINSTEWLSSTMDILKLVRKVSQLFIEDDPSGLVEFLRSDPDKKKNETVDVLGKIKALQNSMIRDVNTSVNLITQFYDQVTSPSRRKSDAARRLMELWTTEPNGTTNWASPAQIKEKRLKFLGKCNPLNSIYKTPLGAIMTANFMVNKNCNNYWSSSRGEEFCLVQSILDLNNNKREALLSFIPFFYKHVLSLAISFGFCSTLENPYNSKWLKLVQKELTEIAENVPKHVERALVERALLVERELSAAWPNIILDNALQQVGNDEIPDGNQSLYQDIANNMLTAVSKRGLERFHYHVVVASAWPGSNLSSWWSWTQSDKSNTFATYPYGCVCHDPEWCVEKRNYRKLNVVILRFDPSETTFNERSEKAINWLEKHNDTFQEFGDDLYTEKNLDQVIGDIDIHLNGTLRGTGGCQKNPKSETSLFRAVIPLRYATTEVISPEMPVPLGLAIGTQGAGNILKMGGVCERWSHRYNYGLQILLFP